MRRFDCCRVVLLTSIVWFTLDVFLLLYFLDCNRSSSSIESEKLMIDKIRDEENSNNLNRVKNLQNYKTKFVPNRNLDETTFKTRKTETGPDDGILAKLMRGLNFNSDGPGEMGRGVHVDKKEEVQMKEKFKENQFNIMASDLISLNRTLPDVRMSQCRSKTYPGNLPGTTVIIVFHNEAWSTLLRSLHSVINRSPIDLLKEIVLVDDASEREYLRGPLEAYLKKLPVPCKLIHMAERSGLIRARLRGAEVAVGPVLTFLDAHIEVINGWLEPLLARIKDSKSNVVAPIIDVISDDTFEYVTASDMTWGGFNWHMNFRWYTVPKRELDRRKGDRAEPIRTPTIAGGLFAIDKDYFYEIGAYDEGMLIWGGENLEISFRVWQCGGQLEIVTCSHVGHVFRKQTPYTFPGGTAYIIHHNAARTVEVWMDNYKEFFYKMTPGARNVEVGDLTIRQEFRKRLKCKSFQWYLKNIYPEAVIPMDYYSLGYIKSPDNNNCLDTMGKKSGSNVGMSRCHNMGGNQAWSYTDIGEIRSDEICLESGGSHGNARLQTCHKSQGNQLWNYDPTTKHLRHVASSQCLTSEVDNGSLKSCRDDDPKQMWILEGYNPAGHNNETRLAGS